MTRSPAAERRPRRSRRGSHGESTNAHAGCAPWAVAGSVIVHCGMPAAGKSTAARAEAELARSRGLSVAVIDKDDIDTQLMVIIPRGLL